MMRILITALALLLGSATDSGAESPWNYGSPRFEALCRGIGNSYKCAKKIEESELGKSNRGVTRNGEVLRIPLANGSTVQLTNDPPGPSGVSYAYREFLPGVNSHVVDVQFWEGRSALLIDSNSGRRTHLHAPPIVSPDNIRFATISQNWALNFKSHAIQIWRIRAAVPTLEFEADPAEWGPFSATWHSPSVLVVYHAALTGPTGESTRYVRSASGWEVSQEDSTAYE